MLGRKSGKGFLDYSSKEKKKPPHPEAIKLLERSPSVKRGVQWRGPSLTEVRAPRAPSCCSLRSSS